MTCDHCDGRGHSPILDENDHSEHAMPDDPYYCACPRGVAQRAWDTKGIVLEADSGFEVGETWYLDMITGEWSQTPPTADQGRPPGRGVITKITRTAVTFDAGPTVVPTAEVPGNRRARRAAKARARRGI